MTAPVELPAGVPYSWRGHRFASEEDFSMAAMKAYPKASGIGFAGRYVALVFNDGRSLVFERFRLEDMWLVNSAGVYHYSGDALRRALKGIGEGGET